MEATAAKVHIGGQKQVLVIEKVRASSTIREPTGQAKREEVRQEGAKIMEDCVEAWGPGGGIWILP